MFNECFYFLISSLLLSLYAIQSDSEIIEETSIRVFFEAVNWRLYRNFFSYS